MKALKVFEHNHKQMWVIEIEFFHYLFNVMSVNMIWESAKLKDTG